MAKEREIKLRIEDLPALRRALRKLGARLVRPRLHEDNLIFDTPEFRLAESEQLLRIRTERLLSKSRERQPQAKLTFKSPGSAAKSGGKRGAHKVREELELEVADPRALAKIFEGLGMRGWIRYEKFRTTFGLPEARAWAKGLLLELDETPIGTYLELEGPAKAIDRAARSLGFHKTDYIQANYMVLYRQYCRRRGEEPGDMVFGRARRRIKSRRAAKTALRATSGAA